MSGEGKKAEEKKAVAQKRPTALAADLKGPKGKTPNVAPGGKGSSAALKEMLKVLGGKPEYVSPLPVAPYKYTMTEEELKELAAIGTYKRQKFVSAEKQAKKTDKITSFSI